jgi:hypothetical protein
MRLLWTLMGAIILTAATLAPAHAAKRDWKAEKVAKKAKETVDAHCAVAEGVGEEAAAAATALQATREEVGKTLEARGQLDLLYWRGVLSQCLEDDGSALNDFNTFLLGRGESTKWQDLADDATRRIADLETYEEPPEEKKTFALAGADPRIVTVAGLGGGSLLFGILSGAAWGASQQQAQVLYSGAHVGSDVQSYVDAGQNAATGSAVLGVSSLITGAAAGAVALILFKPWERSGKVAVVPVVVPLDQGVGFHLTGEW